MKALDIYFIIKELQGLIGAKVDKIYQQKDDMIISLHKQGKILLRITPESLNITEYKFSQKTPPSFCMRLRKFLNQSRITKIIQRGFERIIEIRFQKQEEYILIIELFSKGNIILCESNFKIIAALHIQEWKDRTIKPKLTYIYPPHLKYNLLEIKEKDLETLGKENLVKTLAIDLGLGGNYAEEICLRAKVDKNKKKITKEEIKKIVKAIKNIKEEPLKPNKVKEGVYPFELKIHKEEERESYKTLSQALDNYCEEEIIEDKTFKKRKEKTQKLIKKQKEYLIKLKKAAEEKKIQGDLIYNNYPYIKEVLDTIKKARDKKVDWKEITKKLKTKNIEVKDGGKIILDLK